jgi:dTDP-4-amino-4,6-dideoxygalactose transaminase
MFPKLGKSLRLASYVIPSKRSAEGSRIEEYEKAFARSTGSKYALSFWKGRLGFFAALKALGVEAGDEVVAPGYTCMVISAAIKILGADPVYVDIEPTYCTLDPDKLEDALTPRSKVLMIQHTYGWPSASLERVLDIARERRIAVVEDCCHALGTRHRGTHVGNFGVAGFFSSQWSKPYTTGLGGMLVCNDDEFHERARRIRDEQAYKPGPRKAAQLAAQAIVHDVLVYPRTAAIARNAYRWLSKRSLITGSTSKSEYTDVPKDYFMSMSQAQAAAGLYELRRVEESNRRRRQIARYYVERLQEIGWPVPRWPRGAEVTLLRFPVRVRNKAAALDAADKQLVELGDWFVRPLHSHLAPQEDFGYETGMCPQAEKAAREIVNLPLHTRVSLRQADRVVAFLQRHCEAAEIPAPVERLHATVAVGGT